MTRLSEADARMLLGVGANATPDEIKLAYRELLRICHPDRHNSDPRLQRRAEAMARDIIAAYEVLSAIRNASPRDARPPQRPSHAPTPPSPPPANEPRGASKPRRPPDSGQNSSKKDRPDSARVPHADIPCPKCRKPTKPAATKCGHCWSPLPDADERRRADEETRKKRDRTEPARGPAYARWVPGDIPCPACAHPTKPTATKCGHCWSPLPSADERRPFNDESRATRDRKAKAEAAPDSVDVTPLTLSIEGPDHTAIPVIRRNTQIPVSTTVWISSGEFKVLQGEGPMAADNRELGRVVIDGFDLFPQGIVQVSFDIDANGILRVTARANGKAIGTKLDSSGGLSERDIEKLLNEARTKGWAI